MKFNNEILFFKYSVFSVLLVSIYMNDITSKELKKYPNSRYLLDFHYYHTTTAMDNEIKTMMTTTCPQFIKETSYDQFYKIPISKSDPNFKYLKYYDITNPYFEKKKQKMYILSGEHPRELIAVESLFAFMKWLCEKKDTEASEILKNNVIRIVLNANASNRINVEKGNYCIRTNTKNVDINRNWDYFWGREIQMGEENPGKKPFSEKETLFIKDTVQFFKPKMFLTIHSGMFSMFHPFAYYEGNPTNTDDAKNKLKQILLNIKKEFCPICDVGYPQQILGYKASGTCLDYIYEKYKIPYSFAWEIYGGEKPFTQEILNNYKKFGNAGTPSFNNLQKVQTGYESNVVFSGRFAKMRKSFMELKTDMTLKTSTERLMFHERNYSDGENEECFKQFNPMNKENYKFMTETWKNAIIKTITLVNASP